MSYEQENYVHVVMQHQPAEFSTDQVLEAYECEETAQAEADALNKEYGNSKSHRYYVVSVKSTPKEDDMSISTFKAVAKIAVALVTIAAEVTEVVRKVAKVSK